MSHMRAGKRSAGPAADEPPILFADDSRLSNQKVPVVPPKSFSSEPLQRITSAVVGELGFDALIVPAIATSRTGTSEWTGAAAWRPRNCIRNAQGPACKLDGHGVVTRD